jgi:DeoR/GlpR family transcriptional regulator of sugar metabolism
MQYRSSRQREEKLRIAAAALAHVRDGMSIALTGGTTTTEVARAIVRRDDLTVVTNAINIAELAVRSNIRLIATGGVACSASFELVGPLAGRVHHREDRRSRPAKCRTTDPHDLLGFCPLASPPVAALHATCEPS